MMTLLIVVLALAAELTAQDFARSIRPVLEANCGTCHNPANPKNRLNFLKAKAADDVAAERGLWRNVATQLRNRTMPPSNAGAAAKLTEQDRFGISRWIEERLRVTACAAGDPAGMVTLRRLNRLEYRNTIRELLGVDFAVEQLFPADGSGGEGFDNNGETLFLPPILMERYLEAAQQILDRAIATPPLNRNYTWADLFPNREGNKDKPLVLQPGEEFTATVSVYADGEYTLGVWVEQASDATRTAVMTVDGVDAGKLVFPRDLAGGATAASKRPRLARGSHAVTVKVTGDKPIDFVSLKVDQRAEAPSAERAAVHFRLLHMEPGQAPSNARATTRRFLARFLRKAFRRPVTDVDIDKYMALYDRAEKRGDPYEERIKLALKGVLVSPNFLFKLEAPASPETGRQAVTDHELAVRLSYFLWSTMPDDELAALADAGKLRDSQVLAAQVDRMLDDPRSRSFAHTFIGQWLGTKDVGSRVAPTVNEVQHYYTPEIASDMREEPILLFHSLLTDNRSVLDLINANYTFLTERLLTFYELQSEYPQVKGNGFQRVEWRDDMRGGVLGMGAVLAMTSHFKQTSPVLRGAWVLDTLLGTPAPSPPPDIPPLETEGKKETGLTIRQKLSRHREDPSCAACHDLIDPLGYGLENFDWLGRWRDHEVANQPIDTSGVMPTGEKFQGPAELRGVITGKKEEFLRQFAGKVLGYALGRSLNDADQCTVQKLVDALASDGYRTRRLIRDVVLSTPFRYKSAQPQPN